MLSRLRPTARHMRLAPGCLAQTRLGLTQATMSTFTIPGSGARVNGTPDLSRDDLLSFPAFKIWIQTLQQALGRQQNPSHEFHHDPYTLHSIDIQSIDRFGGRRLGFVKLKANVSNGSGETLPGSVFLRGGSVGMLVSFPVVHSFTRYPDIVARVTDCHSKLILQPDDIPANQEKGKSAILTIQPRIPAGSLAFAEIPAGMLDDSGTFAGGAAKEIEEETGLSVQQSELIDMTSLALETAQDDGETLQKAVYPSAGGSDEFIPLFLCKKRMPRKEIEELRGKLTGLRDHGEKITLKIVPLENLWKEGVRDGKTLAAWALYKGLQQEGKI